MPFFEDSYLKHLIVKIFQVCPEQMQPFLLQVQNATAPRASLRWLQCMDFLESVSFCDMDILDFMMVPAWHYWFLFVLLHKSKFKIRN